MSGMHPDNAEAVDDLVERLRDTFARDHSYLLCAEAANAIEQKDKLIAELRGALAERQAALAAHAPSIDHARRILQFWLDWNKQDHAREGREVDDDFNVMHGGYDNAPPHWPSRGCLRNWIEHLEALHALASSATKGKTTC